MDDALTWQMKVKDQEEIERSQDEEKKQRDSSASTANIPSSPHKRRRTGSIPTSREQPLLTVDTSPASTSPKARDFAQRSPMTSISALIHPTSTSSSPTSTNPRPRRSPVLSASIPLPLTDTDSDVRASGSLKLFVPYSPTRSPNRQILSATSDSGSMYDPPGLSRRDSSRRPETSSNASQSPFTRMPLLPRTYSSQSETKRPFSPFLEIARPAQRRDQDPARPPSSRRSPSPPPLTAQDSPAADGHRYPFFPPRTAIPAPSVPHHRSHRDHRPADAPSIPSLIPPSIPPPRVPRVLELDPALEPSHTRDRRSPPVQTERAWFTLGEMTPVDMRPWDQGYRESYQQGQADALKAVQRGVVGVGGQIYPNPLLVSREISPHVVPRPVSERRASVDRLVGQVYHERPVPDSARPPLASRRPTDQTASTSSFSAGSRRIPAQYDTQYYPSRPGSNRDDPRVPYPHGDYPNPHPHQSNRPLTTPRDNHHGSHPSSRSHRHGIASIHTTSSSGPSAPTTTTTTTSNPPLTLSPGQTSRSGLRQLISCYPCRSRKMKCDGANPCGQCVRRGGEAECNFAATIRRRGKGKKVAGEGSPERSDSGEEELERGESGQESGDERWRRDGKQTKYSGERRQ